MIKNRWLAYIQINNRLFKVKSAQLNNVRIYFNRDGVVCDLHDGVACILHDRVACILRVGFLGSWPVEALDCTMLVG